MKNHMIRHALFIIKTMAAILALGYSGYSHAQAIYRDGRPSATLRMDAKDQGVILKHGDGPGRCDYLGAREALIFEENGVYHLFYDGAGPKGWLACLAISKDLKTWEKKGPVLDFGKPGEADSAAACSPWVYFDGKDWHMFYLGTPNVSRAPDLIPSFPYLTLKARSASLAGPWIKQPEVIPFRCKPHTYYAKTASPGHIVKQGDEYLMFFSASMKRTLGIARTKDLNGPWTLNLQPIVPPEEQIENSSLYFEPSNQTWFLFTNHIGLDRDEYTDAVWVYWSKDLNKWDAADKAVVLDGKNCSWSKKCIGMPSVIQVGKHLAIFYDAPGGDSTSHMKRDLGLAWLELPLSPPKRDAAGVTKLRCESMENPLGIDVAKPRLSWKTEAGGQKPEARGLKQAAYQVLVASSEELLKSDKGDLWDSGKVESDQSIHVEYAGKPLASGMNCFWKVRVWTQASDRQTPGASSWSEPSMWAMGILRVEDWKAQWIQSDLELFDYQKELKKMPDHDREAESPMWARAGGIRSMTAGIEEAPAVWLRKEFSAPAKPLRSARVCVSGLGFYELYINGRKANDHLINCAPYDFDKAVPYQVHDVTQLLRGGENAIGVILGNGYFNPVIPSLLREYAADFIDTPRLLLEMVLEYEDGSRQRVVSDRTWKFTTGGPIRFNSVRAGETYDARRELDGWSSPGYRMESWKDAIAAEAPTGKLVSQNLPPVRKIAEIPAVSVVKKGDGYRFDIGVESTGWARLKVKGKPGQKITIRYPGVGSHTLGRYQECQYICKGDGDESYEPRFAFAGYRFVDVTGLEYEPKPEDLVGCMVVSDLQTRGRFSCSSPELMRVHDVVCRTIRNYNIQMPMDPVREKVCWTQDVQSNFHSSSYNYDVSLIYSKWQDDYIRSVQADGYVPTVVPGCFDGHTINCPWWGGMIIYNAWQHYNFCGDRGVLERSYEPMKRYLGYLDSIAKDGIIKWGLGDWLEMYNGKQPARPIGTTLPFTSTCAYLLYHDILRQTAMLLDKPAEAKDFAARAEVIRNAIDERFYNAAEGFYDKGSQTSFILALKLNLPKASERARLLENLRARIKKDNDHLTCGFIGMSYLLTFLSENGMGDLAWKIATQPTFPGWYDMIFTRNNSVLKEDWAGTLVQMPSLGVSIGGWFYRSLGGIRPDAPGFKAIIIQPYTETLDWVKSEYESPYGLIRSDWRKKVGVLTMEITVPANTTATVYVPAKDADGVTESGKPTDKVEGVKFLRMENGAAVYAVGSGNYRFQSTPMALK